MSVRRLASQTQSSPPAFAFSRGECLAWARADGSRKYPPGRQAVGGDPAAVARAGAGRLGPASRRSRTSPTCSAWPTSACSRSRPSTRMFQLQPVGTQRPCPGLRHDALHAARRGGADGRLPPKIHHDQFHTNGRRHVLLGGGRVPRRLRERADGADLQGHLRGPDAGALGRAHRRLRRRQGRTVEPGRRTAAVSGAGGRPDDARDETAV